MVLTCHCDFCQKRTGSVMSVGAQFAADQITAVTGETKTYNGLEVDGVGGPNGVGISYTFCATCGSTLLWSFDVGESSITGIAVGNFVEQDLPAPTVEYYTATRHRWLPPVRGATQHAGSGAWEA